MSEVKKIPEGWVETTLEIISNKVTDGSHQSPKSVQDGMPMLSVKDMNEFGFDIENSKKISKKDYDFLVKQGCKPNVNDILIAKDGSVLKHIFRVKEEINAVLLSSIAIITPNELKINPSYLGYILINPNFKKYILNNFLSGSGVPRIVLKDFKKIEFIIPKNINEQKSIAAILTAFDNKIELLQAQNKTLEATAQTIFTEWFGKYSVDDELPEGWSVGKLSDLVEKISKGTTATKDDLIGLYGEIPFLKVKDISNDGLILKNNLELIPKSVHENQLKRSILETNDILFSIAGTIGRLAIVDLEMNEANCNQALAFIRLKDKYTYLEYIHLWLKSKETQDVIISNIVQGVQANVSLTVLGNLLLLIPNSENINNWCNLIKPIYKKLQLNTEQIQTLTKTRDELLPRLMSGEVRVNELKK